MPTLKQALEDLKSTRTTADTETYGPPRTQSCREMLRREAQRRLPEVRKAYMTEFRKIGFPVFLQGPGIKAFTELAKEETEILATDYQAATSETKTMVRGSISPKTREFTPHHFTVMVRGCRQLAVDLGMDSIPQPDFDQIEVVQTDADVDAVVDRYLLKYFGGDFLAAVIEKQVLTVAEELVTDAAVVPVLISGVPESIIEAVGPRILCRKYLSVEVPQEVTSDFVTGVFKKVRSAMKSKKTEV
jgi:hypothetical protein